jgi:hypothetical protein
MQFIRLPATGAYVRLLTAPITESDKDVMSQRTRELRVATWFFSPTLLCRTPLKNLLLIFQRLEITVYNYRAFLTHNLGLITRALSPRLVRHCQALAGGSRLDRMGVSLLSNLVVIRWPTTSNKPLLAPGNVSPVEGITLNFDFNSRLLTLNLILTLTLLNFYNSYI